MSSSSWCLELISLSTSSPEPRPILWRAPALRIGLVLIQRWSAAITIIFVVGEDVYREADACGVEWIADTPTANGNLLEFWRKGTPEMGAP